MVHYKMWTLCMVQRGDEVLLLDRQHDHFKGFIPPGGKVEFPESIADSAIREVEEETGLQIHTLTYKGLYEYVNPTKGDRYMIFNYLATDFSGTLIENSPEGKAMWVKIADVDKLPMQTSIRRRFPLFFEEGTFEFQVEWNEQENCEGAVHIRRT